MGELGKIKEFPQLYNRILQLYLREKQIIKIVLSTFLVQDGIKKQMVCVTVQLNGGFSTFNVTILSPQKPCHGQNQNSTKCLDLLCHFLPGTSLGHLPGPLSLKQTHYLSLFQFKAAVRKRWKELPHLVQLRKLETEFVYHLQFHSHAQYL